MDESSLRTIFAEVFGLDAGVVSDEMNPETVEAWDSFGHMRLVTAVEHGCSVRLTMDEIVSIDSFATLRNVIANASGR